MKNRGFGKFLLFAFILAMQAGAYPESKTSISRGEGNGDPCPKLGCGSNGTSLTGVLEADQTGIVTEITLNSEK